jgi:multiple sugar transport system permease protein
MKIRIRKNELLLKIICFLSVAINPLNAENYKNVTTLTVWGMWDTEGDRAVIEAFERKFPNVKVNLVRIAGGMDPQKLMTAIAGNKPPDAIQQDRFSIGEWASRDAFLPLDDFIKRDNLKVEEMFYSACIKEATYEGKIYALPRYTDDRALYYNRNLFREVGLDPNKPPKTWDELYEYSKKLTKYDNQGRFLSIGFIPNFGNSWLYLYGWQNGGHFMSEDGRTCLLNEPAIVEALEWMVNFYDSFKGIEAINSFSSTFQGGQYDPFLTGKIGMRIDGNWFLQHIAWYAPDLDFGVAPAPVPKGKPFITWSGGFSMAIPRGCRHLKESWEFIKFVTSVEGWLIYVDAEARRAKLRNLDYVPLLTANSIADKIIFERYAPRKKNLRDGLKVFLELMPYSKFRPVTPVGQKLWDEHVRAFELAVYHKLSPKEALDRGTEEVQKQLDKILYKPPYKPVNWKIAIIISFTILLIGIILMIIKGKNMVRENPLLKYEIRAGITFVLPWVLGFLIFTAGPIITSLVLSFTEYDVLHPPSYVGLKNYYELIAKDTLFWKSLYNTFYITIFNVPLSIICGLGLSMLLNNELKFIPLFRTLFFLPSIMPVVATAILWLWILHPEFGLVNSFIKQLNLLLGKMNILLPVPQWLGSEVWSKPSLILMGLWGVGGGVVFWLAGLNSIPRQLYEAAEIDGANWWQKFLNITLPLLTPYIFFSIVMGVIGSLQVFAQAYVMTGGGPVDSTLFYVYYLFNNAFRYFRMGYASAMAWILFLVILVLTLIQIKLAPKWVHYR